MSTTAKSIVADILGIDAAAVTDELSNKTAGNWDSLNHLRIITALEQELGISFTMAEIQSIDCYGKLAAIIAAKGRSA